MLIDVLIFLLLLLLLLLVAILRSRDMFRKVKLLFYLFVFQNILSSKFENGKLYDSPAFAVINLLTPGVSFFYGFIYFTILDSKDIFLKVAVELETSSFVIFFMQFMFYVQPLTIEVLCIIIYKKRRSMRKFLMICYRICSFSNTSFDGVLKSCIKLAVTLQFLLTIQWIINYITYYQVSLSSVLTVFFAAWSMNLKLYVILLATFFLKFVDRLFDECLEEKNIRNIYELENRLLLMNSLFKTFNDVFGYQLTFVFIAVIFAWIAHVSREQMTINSSKRNIKN